MRKRHWVGIGFGVSIGDGFGSTLGVARDAVSHLTAPSFGDSRGGRLGFTLGDEFVLNEVVGDALGVARNAVSHLTAPCISCGESLGSTLGVARDAMSH